jgi:hypothetical protein
MHKWKCQRPKSTVAYPFVPVFVEAQVDQVEQTLLVGG